MRHDSCWKAAADEGIDAVAGTRIKGQCSLPQSKFNLKNNAKPFAMALWRVRVINFRSRIRAGGAKIYIALATTDFALYQDITRELREKRLKFVTVAPSEAIGREVGVVITSDQEASAISFPNVVIASDPEIAVSEAIRRLRNTGVPESAVIGIDPGDEPGIAVVANGIVEAVYRVPLRQASKIVERIQQTYPKILVRIGNGARLTSTHLANALISRGVAVEFVDESGTSPYLGKGTAGIAISDVVAAINIAYTHGTPAGHQDVLPSKGEIRWIQERTRELSEGRTTISRKLAQRVAKGEITINQALAEHAGASDDQTH